MIVLAAAAILLTPINEIPSRILMNATDNLATKATVTWRTESPAESVGQIAVASADPGFVNSSTTVPGEGNLLVISEEKSVTYHSVTFEDLEPETQYAYRVGSIKGWSEWVHFTTASDQPKDFSFIYFGDAQNSVKSMWSRTVRKAFRDLPYADLMLHAGDLINVPNADNEWQDWFYAGGWIHSHIPAIAVPGNHEYRQGEVSNYWKPQFEFPKNGIDGLEDSNYYFDFQGARFIALNTNEKVEEQTPWLQTVLENNPNRWTFVTFHHPVFSTATGRDNPNLRKLWQPLFQKHNVAIVLQGHDHTYGRRNLPTGAANEDAGTVYVVSVSGPKMYSISEEARKTMQKTGERKQLYQIIQVTHDKVRFESYLTTGELFDSFELTKNADGTNQFSTE